MSFIKLCGYMFNFISITASVLTILDRVFKKRR